MKTRLIPTLVLLALLLASCAPKAVNLPSQPAVVLPSAIPVLEVTTKSLQDEATDVSGPTPFPIATSRGPDLEATDPATVSLASGDLQLVEFFRFT